MLVSSVSLHATPPRFVFKAQDKVSAARGGKRTGRDPRVPC